MSDDPRQIRIDVLDPDAEPTDLEQETLALRRDLLDLDDVGTVTPVAGQPPPPGSRAVGAAEIGSLLVAAQPVAEVVVRVVGAVRAWLARRASAGQRTATLRITVGQHSLELTPTEDEQTALVEEFLRVVAADDTPADDTPADG